MPMRMVRTTTKNSSRRDSLYQSRYRPVKKNSATQQHATIIDKRICDENSMSGLKLSGKKLLLYRIQNAVANATLNAMMSMRKVRAFSMNRANII